MFWADILLKDISKKQRINDSFTPSGIVHMGSLKGPVIHDTLFRVLQQKGVAVAFQYGFDDIDPIDGLPKDLMETHRKYLGIPLCVAPSPDGNGTFGDYFANKMFSLLQQLGIKPDIYRTSELYRNGTFNKAIQLVLDRVDDIRKVYGEIYKKEILPTWFPFQVICPNCGKVGTTKVTGWDGKEVSFSCEESLVQWAKGCGVSGKMSPFNGNGKMAWKVEWAAKWWTFGVTIEGAGKDHASVGGSYDVAAKICKDVFKKDPPFKFGYEFFLSGGKKMSSSKGLGLTGEELLEVLPSEIVRMLMIKTPPNQAVEFSPFQTDTIPNLYDAYQKTTEAYFEKGNPDLSRAFKLSQVGEIKKPPSIRFSVLVQWVQMPNMESKIREEGLEEWAKYARVWIERFAPESEKFVVQKELPEATKSLSEKQKQFLKKVASELDREWDADEFQKQIYEYVKALDFSSKDAFAAIYISLLGKDHGPKAAWLILSLDKDFVKKRFNSISHSGKPGAHPESNSQTDSGQARMTDSKHVRAISPEIFSINTKLKEKFPSASIGIAIIKGVTIKKEDPELKKEKEEFLKSLENLTTEELGKFPEIVSYRKLYKDMGIDWHSRRPSPEALLRRVALKKGLYTVNTCVDAYNLVVMKHRVSVGAFDYNKIEFPTVLRFAKEGEAIHLLGEDEPTKYKEGEIAYFDKKGGFNIDFNYRDAQRTAVQLNTKNLYINVDGVFDISSTKVEEVLKEACDMIIKYCGGELEKFGVVIVS